MENMMKEEKKKVKGEVEKMTMMIEEVKSKKEAKKVEEPEEKCAKEMQSFPQSCKGRQQVETLDLGNTDICELPELIGECQELMKMNLNGTKVTKLP